MLIILPTEILELFIMQNYYSKNPSNTEIAIGSRVLPKTCGNEFEFSQCIVKQP